MHNLAGQRDAAARRNPSLSIIERAGVPGQERDRGGKQIIAQERSLEAVRGPEHARGRIRSGALICQSRQATQGNEEFLDGAGHQEDPVVAMIAGDLLRVAHVVEAELRVCHEVVMESERSDAEIFLVMRGEREHVVAGGQGGPVVSARRLLKDHMAVRPAQTEAADAGAPRLSGLLPRREAVVDEDRR